MCRTFIIATHIVLLSGDFKVLFLQWMQPYGATICAGAPICHLGAFCVSILFRQAILTNVSAMSMKSLHVTTCTHQTHTETVWKQIQVQVLQMGSFTGDFIYNRCHWKQYKYITYNSCRSIYFINMCCQAFFKNWFWNKIVCADKMFAR